VEDYARKRFEVKGTRFSLTGMFDNDYLILSWTKKKVSHKKSFWVVGVISYFCIKIKKNLETSEVMT